MLFIEQANLIEHLPGEATEVYRIHIPTPCPQTERGVPDPKRMGHDNPDRLLSRGAGDRLLDAAYVIRPRLIECFDTPFDVVRRNQRPGVHSHDHVAGRVLNPDV